MFPDDAANAPERSVAAEMLERVDLDGYTVIVDKGFAGEEFEQHMATLGANYLRPDRKDQRRRHGSLGPIRQWIESVIWTCKAGSPRRTHAGRRMHPRRTPPARPAGILHKHDIGDPGRHSLPTATETESTI
jgi:hypothetical protein